MLPNFDHSEMPRALQHLMDRDRLGSSPTALPRRSFLKLAGAGGLALGLFPQLATAQEQAGALKPTQQPLPPSCRSHRVARSPSPSTDWSSVKACRPACR
jgi:anaerobic selenocysteine-containing dehydrogenase